MFMYPFMQKALLVGALLGLIVPSIGLLMVTKRFAMMGDALSHMSLAGVTIGLIFNFNPILGALVACIIAALSIDVIRKYLPQHAETSIAIITSAGIGLAGLLSGFVGSSTNFNSFLFGSIVAITNQEVLTVIIITLIVLFFMFRYYDEFFLVALDEKNAKLLGINVKFINLLSLLLTAIVVSIAARIVGALIISSLMVIPVVSALQVSKSYKQTLIYSIGFGLFYMVVGLILSYQLQLKPGATIVLLGLVTLIILFVSKGFQNMRKGKNS